MVDISKIKCEKCNEGMMESKDLKRHNMILIGAMYLVGAVLTATVLGAIIGIPLIIAGVKLNGVSDRWWVCEKCKHKIKKIEQ